jgi:hypothetical protein
LIGTGGRQTACREADEWIERRAEYYRELGRDADARAFTTTLKSKLTAALTRLNRTIPLNPKVRILWRGKNRISITPFEALPPARGREWNGV